jgi:hypothetical protein
MSMFRVSRTSKMSSQLTQNIVKKSKSEVIFVDVDVTLTHILLHYFYITVRKISKLLISPGVTLVQKTSVLFISKLK